MATSSGGLQKDGLTGAFSVKLMDTSPTPPLIGENVWTIEVLDHDGNPVEGCTVTAGTWMPDHQHGSPIIAQSTELGGGMYDVEIIDLFMPGLWEITLNITGPTGSSDKVVFKFWIHG